MDIEVKPEYVVREMRSLAPPFDSRFQNCYGAIKCTFLTLHNPAMAPFRPRIFVPPHVGKRLIVIYSLLAMAARKGSRRGWRGFHSPLHALVWPRHTQVFSSLMNKNRDEALVKKLLLTFFMPHIASYASYFMLYIFLCKAQRPSDFLQPTYVHSSISCEKCCRIDNSCDFFSFHVLISTTNHLFIKPGDPCSGAIVSILLQTLILPL